MAHLHNFAKQTGIVMGNIGQKVKQTVEIAGHLKAIFDIGFSLKNGMIPIAEVAMVAAPY